MGLIFKIHHETQDWCDLPSENGIWDMSGDSMASFIQHFFGGLEKKTASNLLGLIGLLDKEGYGSR